MCMLKQKKLLYTHKNIAFATLATYSMPKWQIGFPTLCIHVIMNIKKWYLDIPFTLQIIVITYHFISYQCKYKYSIIPINKTIHHNENHIPFTVHPSLVFIVSISLEGWLSFNIHFITDDKTQQWHIFAYSNNHKIWK